MNNFEYLCEHDRDALIGMIDEFVPCDACPLQDACQDDGSDFTECRAWMQAEHIDAQGQVGTSRDARGHDSRDSRIEELESQLEWAMHMIDKVCMDEAAAIKSERINGTNLKANLKTNVNDSREKLSQALDHAHSISKLCELD